MTPPHRAYYEAHVDRWRCDFRLRITDREAFRRCRMPLVDRLGILFMAHWPRALGRMWLETSVAFGSGERASDVVHTTRVKLWRTAVLTGVEWLTLSDDGTSVALECVHKVAPLFWRTRRFEGRATIAADGQSAHYSFAPWFGTTLEQRTKIEGRALAIHQETPWCTSTLLLQRVVA